MNVIAMRRQTFWVVVAAVALACAGCSSTTAVQQSAKPSQNAAQRSIAAQPERANAPLVTPEAPLAKGKQELERAIRSYEEGAYKPAARQFQAALELGLDANTDQAAAHKYMAFIVCVSGREKACRDEFRKALDADPNFELAPAEAGHPIWAAVLRSVKSDAVSRSKAK